MKYEILKDFHEIASSPRKQMDKYLAEGKKIVLTVPYYTPDEIVHSMGLVPMGTWGADMELNRAKEYFPAFMCSIVQSILELGINGKFAGASAIIIPSLCDTLKTLGENWKYAVKDIKFIPMVYPQNRKPAFGVKFTKAGYERVIKDLEVCTGASFSLEKLTESNRIYNEHNAVMREIDEVLAKHPEVSVQERSDIFNSANYMLAEDHTKMVKKLIEELNANDAGNERDEYKLPIIVSGILTDMPGLNEAFDEFGMHVVADDVCAHSRQYRTDVPEDSDALNALAQKFANTDNCSVLYNVEKPRVKWIADTAKERGAKGVVVVMTKFCDPEEFDFVVIKRACEENDLPLALIEVDRQMNQFEQVKTNLETFRDMLTL